MSDVCSALRLESTATTAAVDDTSSAEVQQLGLCGLQLQKSQADIITPLQVNKYVETEIVNHSLMRHPHIIQFRDVFVTSNFICIVLEYAGAGTLHSYVRRFGHLKESVARWFFQQLALAVDYCHKKGVANRDIKLENTLLHVSSGIHQEIHHCSTCSGG